MKKSEIQSLLGVATCSNITFLEYFMRIKTEVIDITLMLDHIENVSFLTFDTLKIRYKNETIYFNTKNGKLILALF